jgi:hypothetical protein
MVCSKTRTSQQCCSAMNVTVVLLLSAQKHLTCDSPVNCPEVLQPLRILNTAYQQEKIIKQQEREPKG